MAQPSIARHVSGTPHLEVMQALSRIQAYILASIVAAMPAVDLGVEARYLGLGVGGSASLLLPNGCLVSCQRTLVPIAPVFNKRITSHSTMVVRTFAAFNN